MLKIALTGGIGSGKSTVAKYFANLNVPIVDADKITHELLQPHTRTYKKILTHFGQSFLNYNNTINRTKLRALIFKNPKERTWLEKMLHPLVYAKILQQIASFQAPYCIMVIPLFFESKIPIKADRTLVIDCSQKIQLERTRKRKNYTSKQIKAIIASQYKRKERLERANDIIYNRGTLGELKKAVKELHNFYCQL